MLVNMNHSPWIILAYTLLVIVRIQSWSQRTSNVIPTYAAPLTCKKKFIASHLKPRTCFIMSRVIPTKTLCFHGLGLNYILAYNWRETETCTQSQCFCRLVVIWSPWIAPPLLTQLFYKAAHPALATQDKKILCQQDTCSSVFYHSWLSTCIQIKISVEFTTYLPGRSGSYNIAWLPGVTL